MKRTTRRRRQHVLMLVNNSCVNDARVIKSAEALAEVGWRVTVLCRQEKDLPVFERRDGVVYRRVEATRLSRRALRGHPPVCQPRDPVPDRSLAFRILYLLLRPAKLMARRLMKSVASCFESDEFGAAAVKVSKSLQPDVVHAHDLAALPAAARIARARGAGLVYDSHELEMHRNAAYGAVVRRRRQRLESRFIKRADAVVTVSDSIADHLRDAYRIPRPHVILNAPFYGKGASPVSHVKGDLRLGSGVPLAVYVGKVTVNRGLEIMVRALSCLPDVHFATVGPRLTAIEQVLEETAHEEGVRDRLHFVDPVSPGQVVDYIRSADVSVLPIQNVCLSYDYCFPNKLLESVFAGVPVAVADLREMKRFVNRHRCGLVMDETDPRSIASVVGELLDNRDAFVIRGDKLARLKEEYGWEAQAAKLCGMYDDLYSPGLGDALPVAS